MLVKVSLFLLSIGVYASYADGNSECTANDELFDESCLDGSEFTTNGKLFDESYVDSSESTTNSELFDESYVDSSESTTNSELFDESYVDSSESTTRRKLFDKVDFLFPKNFLSRYPAEGEFTTKTLVYILFNFIVKGLSENEFTKFWSKLNQNNCNRLAVDAVFYEYLSKFTDRKMKRLVFDPLKSSEKSPEEIAIDRIGDYLDNLSANELPTDQSETRSKASKTKSFGYNDAKCADVSLGTPVSGTPWKDFPNYCDIPKTSFTCANKFVPGVYADIETGCQVFHVCWPRRLESFLCPIGTTFNQELLTCDFWHGSDCSSAPELFDNSPFAEEIPRTTEPTATMGDDTQTTWESSSAFTPELDIPEYDGTCQSLISKSLQPGMKFLPAKCKVAYLKPSKYHEKRFSREMADILSRSLRDVLEFTIKAAEIGSSEIKRKEAAKRPDMEMERHNLNLDARFGEETTELKPERIDEMNGEQAHHSTTELPFDELVPRVDSGFVKKPVFKEASQENVKHGRSVRKSTVLEPSKMSEDSKKIVLDTMTRTLEVGSNLQNDVLLPLLKKIILNSPGKTSYKLKKSSAVNVQ